MISILRTKHDALAPVMDERARRYWAACEARALGRGGVTAVARATGISRTTIRAGLGELQRAPQSDITLPDPQRLRRQGAGRKRLSQVDRQILDDLRALVESTTRGDPESPLQWTCRSCRNLADELVRQGHQVSYRTVGSLLHELGYSLQANRKMDEGADHSDRDAQFQHISRRVKAFLRRGQPVISVDTKKKELVGKFRASGREWRPEGDPERVRVHDFKDEELGKAVPYGVYDLAHNDGWVSVGIDHDTAQFACETLRRWWREMGALAYPTAKELLVTADSGGSNGARCRLWKVALQNLADAIGVKISVCHFPPGTSKWNRIEHRMFCHISQNWRGKPLVSRSAIVELIGHTRTRSGLRIRAALDTNTYPQGIAVSDEELAAVRIKKDKFHGEWNYTILPRGN
jgi:Rhodopirellula transposase DDE domain